MTLESGSLKAGIYFFSSLLQHCEDAIKKAIVAGLHHVAGLPQVLHRRDGVPIHHQGAQIPSDSHHIVRRVVEKWVREIP